MKKRFLYSVHRHCLQLLLLFAGAVAHAQSPGWAVDPAAYQYGMTMVAQIRIDDVPNHQANNHLAVFSQGQIRGYATPVIFSGQAYYFLNLYSKAYKGDTLYFRAFIGADGKVYESTDTVIFKHHLALGTIGEPFQVHLNLGDRPLIYTLLEVDYEANTCPEVLDIQSTDQQNSEGNGLIYSITGGADAARFSINPQTGLLSWLNFNPDFTMPSDADGDNRYEVQVKVQDASGLFDEQYITVQVVEGLPLPPLLCPDDLTIHTSDDGTGDCGATSDQTGIPLSGPCAANLFQYELNGATAGGGTGLVPPGQVFARGLTTVVYIRIAGGGNSECAFTVLVEDDEMPTITCPDDVTLAPDITNPCGAEVDGINAEFTDNCSGAGISYELEGATTGSGSGQAAGQIFPTGVTTVTYTVTDGADHYSDCTFTVTVTNCNTEFSGTILWEHDGTSGVQNTTVNLTGSATGSDLSDVNGDYLISLPYQTGNFTLKPVKNLNKLNGVTTADVTAIQQHVGNASLLPAPFKRIAADVNKSNSITSVDA
ncbi:MAG: HYR domain-containing protein, partial [Lewinellaceae bacterium]|nr:HYR domain-containing protein [Lewinellaceae bacterium]